MSELTARPLSGVPRKGTSALPWMTSLNETIAADTARYERLRVCTALPCVTQVANLAGPGVVSQS